MNTGIEESLGCTVGVARIQDGILVFKNRDLPREYILNRVTVFQSTPEIHALKGVNLKTKGIEGVSIGVNRSRVCVANTHVFTTPGAAYDLLCEEILVGAKARQDVDRIVKDFVARNEAQGGRILVASPEWGVLVEVLDRDFGIQEIDGGFIVTNHFSFLVPQRAGLPKPGGSSLSRLETAQRMLKEITGPGPLKEMLRSHLPEKGGSSICNHGDGGGTESSHIIQIQGSHVSWSSLYGSPCRNDYQTVALFQT